MHTNKQKIDVSIITVGMNHLNYLKPYLHSLFVENPPKCNFELIYVDNCSKDGSVEYIQKNYSQVRIIENTDLLGFGENNNKGAYHAKGKYIAIINPDIEILPDSLDQLYQFAESLKNDAIIAPKLINKDGSFQYSVRRFMTLGVFVTRAFTKGNDNSKNKIIQNYLFNDIEKDKVQTIDWAIGASLFLSNKLFKKLKGFDTDYFLYFEDVDLCLRCWKIGSQVIYFPKSQMIHNHLRASAKLGKKTVMHLKSLITFFFKQGFFVRSRSKTASLEF